MTNEILTKLITIIARFDQGITEAKGGEGIDKPAIREVKLILSDDGNTSFVYDLNHNDAAEIVGSFSLLKKGEDESMSMRYFYYPHSLSVYITNIYILRERVIYALLMLEFFK